ncbi:MAG: LysR substrate-binding domain-containing protein [Planctomycetota bacterium]|nr:LysR substrate-binding domain-containing protein [Planctomycetota bacterium]
MELQQLRYFVAAAECGSVSRAADRCHVAQPSLSQQLKKLEVSLGVNLFDRMGRGIVITDAGRALLPRARRILAEVRDTELNITREAGDCQGTLTVGAIPTMAPYLLPAALENLRAAYPKCQIAVREGLTETLVEALADNEIDCALLSTPVQDDLLEIEVLAEEELLIAVPRSHPAAAHSEVTFADLRGQPTVSLEEIHCLGRQIQGFCSARHLARRVVCRTTQLLTILELVALGVGISMVPEMAAAADRSGRCGYPRLRPGKPVRQIAVAWRQGRSRSMAASRFVELVSKNLRGGLHSLSPSKPVTPRTIKRA